MATGGVRLAFGATGTSSWSTATSRSSMNELAARHLMRDGDWLDA
jgi:hypothetical protein